MMVQSPRSQANRSFAVLQPETFIPSRFAVPCIKAALLFILATSLLALIRGAHDTKVWEGILVGLCGPAWMLAPVIWRQLRVRKGVS